MMFAFLESWEKFVFGDLALVTSILILPKMTLVFSLVFATCYRLPLTVFVTLRRFRGLSGAIPPPPSPTRSSDSLQCAGYMQLRSLCMG